MKGACRQLRNPDHVWPEEAHPLSSAEAERDAAWSRYVNRPHTDISVGWAEYLAELESIRSRVFDRENGRD